MIPGRPKVEIEIQGRRVKGLRNTGASINVRNDGVFNLLNAVELRESRKMLRCANNNILENLWKIMVDVQIG